MSLEVPEPYLYFLPFPLPQTGPKQWWQLPSTLRLQPENWTSRLRQTKDDGREKRSRKKGENNKGSYPDRRPRNKIEWLVVLPGSSTLIMPHMVDIAAA